MTTGIVNIRGKQYETVALRVHKFRERFPDYRLLTEIIERSDVCVVMRATVFGPDGNIIANGHAEEYRRASEINKTSALENCETSAIGRALASLGIGGTEFASADEVERAVNGEKGEAPKLPDGPITPAGEDLSRCDPKILGKIVDKLREHVANDRTLGIREEWEQLEDHYKVGVWRSLTRNEKDAVRAATAKEAA